MYAVNFVTIGLPKIYGSANFMDNIVFDQWLISLHEIEKKNYLCQQKMCR